MFWGENRYLPSPDMENEMAEHILLMAKMFYGFTPIEIRRLAFEFAEKK